MSTRITTRGKAAAAVAVLAATLSFANVGPAAAAASCPTDQGAKTQVAALVAQLHDVIHSRSARANTRLALVQSRHALRDEHATTTAKRANLGRQISALAKTLHTAKTREERKAIITAIHALQAQKQRGPVTDAQRAQLKADNAALQKAVVAKLDTKAQIKS
ncbi:MAG: hypothetical protein ACXV4A_04260, partial [Actinomycetes bacterium]